jgi:hypothetical protein
MNILKDYFCGERAKIIDGIEEDLIIYNLFVFFKG